jgi:hypothetical protein
VKKESPQGSGGCSYVPDQPRRRRLGDCLMLVGITVRSAAAAGTVPSHLSLGVNNPSCVGCTVSMTVSLSFDDYSDPTGSVVHVTRTVGGTTTALPDLIVGSGTWPWFYDYPTIEGLYHYVFSFDGDAIHAPAEATADVTVERRAVSLGLNVWSDPHGTGHVYAYLSDCHSNCVVVLSVSSGTKPPREIARVEVPVGGGYTPTVDFKRKGATAVYASYAGDDWFLPAQTVWSYPF